jgi:pentatricopeptide repeat protein
MPAKAPNDSAFVLADAIRSACIKAAVQAYDDAGIRGLCQEGRWECALAALRQLDLRRLTGLLDEQEPTN